jgi:hypothetical protein
VLRYGIVEEFVGRDGQGDTRDVGGDGSEEGLGHGGEGSVRQTDAEGATMNPAGRRP